jgi:hypothetical protein
MKPLWTRVFARNAPAAIVIAAIGCGITGLAAGPALARMAQGPAPRAVADHGTGVSPSGRWISVPWHAEVDLVITVRDTATSPAVQWTLTCGPDGGTLPDPAQACARLNEIRPPFAPLSSDVMCPMIVSGPQTATISGYWHGSRIFIQLNRDDGCQAARWNRLIVALGLNDDPGQVNPGGLMQPGPGQVTH